MANLRRVLQEKQGFSEAESAIADYLVEHFRELGNFSTRQLAKATYTNSAAIVRFTQKLGFEGYVDFKVHFMAEMMQHEDEPPERHFTRKDNVPLIMEKMMYLGINTFKETHDILDPAILRPGRFDRKVSVGRPDVKGREEILRVHAANKHIGDDVDMKEIARTTAGFAGADLENLLNEAAINAVIENRQFITKADVDKSFIKVGIGTEKRSRLVPDSEKRITAYHEAGHAILFHELSEMDPVFTVSIVPTGDSAAGYTMPLPGNDNRHVTKTKMLQHIMVDLGGRIAEELVFDDITTGASQDIKMASKTARDMVVKYGFSPKLGLINYEANDDEQVFLGKELGHERFYGEKVAADIDSEVKRIIDECYEKAKEIIVSKRDILDKSAALLLEKEKITGAEFDALFT